MRGRGYDGSAKHCCAKIAIPKDTSMVTSNLLVPGSTYQGSLFQLLGQLRSHHKLTSAGIKWNRGATTTSRRSCLGCLVLH